MILRPYHKGDEVAILSLFSQCFGREMKADFWKWRFLNNPVCQCLIYLAWDNETLASHYAVSPVVASIEDKDYLTGLSMTTMTGKDYRGLKLFQQLANKAYARMVDLSYSMVWGFPNIQIHRVRVRDLGWEDIYEIPTMKLKIDPTPKSTTYNIVTDDHFDFDYIDNLYSSRLMHVKKDKQYLRWRYADNPINQYVNLVITKEQQVSSFCIVKKYSNSLDIVDFQACNEDEGEILLNQSVYFACQNNLESINCWAPRHHFIHSLCEKMGFINKEPITYLGYRQLAENKLKKILNNYSDWYIQMGDSDVY